MVPGIVRQGYGMIRNFMIKQAEVKIVWLTLPLMLIDCLFIRCLQHQLQAVSLRALAHFYQNATLCRLSHFKNRLIDLLP